MLVASSASCDSTDSAITVSSAADSRSRVIPDTVAEIVRRARAYDRAEKRDSARMLYDAAISQLPQIADWLRLRAAGVTPSGSDRAKYYQAVRSPVARERIPWTEAFALERFGDPLAAIAKYRLVDAMPSVFRLRLATTGSAAKNVVRDEMIGWMAKAPSSDLLRDVVWLFDNSFPKRAPGEELVLARAAWRAGDSKRAVAGYASAMKAKLGKAQDHFDYGLALARLNQNARAIAEFNKVKSPLSLAAAAQYQRARASIDMGNTAQARTVLRNITNTFPKDTSSAAALLLLSDLATDEQRDDDARQTLLTIVKRYSASRQAPIALYRAALIAWIAGQKKIAALEFDSIAKRYPDFSEVPGAHYWAGRSWAALGDTAKSRERWRTALAAQQSSYYAVMSAKRLGVPVLTNPALSDNYPSVPDVDSAAARVAILRDAGMDVEMRFEWNRLYERAGDSRARIVATSHALIGTEQSTRSILLGFRALKESGPTSQNYRLVFPLLERETLISAAKENEIDPVLVASLIRQESNFNPLAVSSAGARGLMQLLPRVGRQLAAGEEIRDWNDNLLFDPAINVKLGTRHLRGLLRGNSDLVKVLAAYNAGESRVARWKTKAGAGDPEIFTERIPFNETRDYVRNILRNREFYRELYAW